MPEDQLLCPFPVGLCTLAFLISITLNNAPLACAVQVDSGGTESFVGVGKHSFDAGLTRTVKGDEFTEDEIYYEKIYLAQNPADFIYAPFVRGLKYFRFFLIGHKVAIVTVSVMLQAGLGTVQSGGPGIGLSFLLHALFLTFAVVKQPYLAPGENLLVIVTESMLVLIAALGFIGSFTEIPTVVWVIAGVGCIVLPAVAVVWGAVITFKAEVRLTRDREERVHLAQQHAENDDESSAPYREISNELSANGRGGAAQHRTDNVKTKR